MNVFQRTMDAQLALDGHIYNNAHIGHFHDNLTRFYSFMTQFYKETVSLLKRKKASGLGRQGRYTNIQTVMHASKQACT